MAATRELSLAINSAVSLISRVLTPGYCLTIAFWNDVMVKGGVADA